MTDKLFFALDSNQFIENSLLSSMIRLHSSGVHIYQPKMTRLCDGILKQTSALYVIRSLENELLKIIVFHCNQPLRKPVSIYRWCDE